MILVPLLNPKFATAFAAQCVRTSGSGALELWETIAMPDLPLIAAVLIFGATYAFVAVGKIPIYRIDRAGAALLGASLMVGTGVLSAEEAYKAIDFDTITLLLGMMIVVANLRISGFFRVVTDWIATHVRYPLPLLVAVVLAAGVLSAFLVNDTICLVMTPLVLELVTRVGR